MSPMGADNQGLPAIASRLLTRLGGVVHMPNYSMPSRVHRDSWGGSGFAPERTAVGYPCQAADLEIAPCGSVKGAAVPPATLLMTQMSWTAMRGHRL
jgi:hypothetical protein